MRNPSGVNNCNTLWKIARNIEDIIMEIVYFLFELDRLVNFRNEKPIQKSIPRNFIMELIVIIDILILLWLLYKYKYNIYIKNNQQPL